MPKPIPRQCVDLFNETIGWPYASPGVTDDRGVALGIDCSGEWVRVARKFGLSIDHGSNAQYRKFAAEKGEITSESQLRVGMAVFKVRAWNPNDPDDVKHRNYGEAPGNIYHVGCVTSVNPLRITHATPNEVKVDTALGKWTLWAWLKIVDYKASETTSEPSMPTSTEAKGLYRAIVRTDETGLNFRRTPSKDSGRVNGMKVIPKDATVDVIEETNAEWAKVEYQGYTGYAARQYLQRIAETPEPVDVAAHVVEIYAYRGDVMDSTTASTILSIAQTMGYTGLIRESDD